MTSNNAGKGDGALRFIDFGTLPKRMLAPIEGYENMPLVSLEEAVKPLVNIVPKVVRNVFLVKQNCNKPDDGLSSDESASIMLYTLESMPHENSLYVILNASLRSEQRQKLVPWFLYLRLILTALARLPPERHFVVRGVKADLRADYPRGSTFIWWGFSSCTSSVEVLESEDFFGKTGIRTLFQIDCQSGKNIKKHSFMQQEDEILLPPARQFQVTGCLDSGNGLHIISLKEIQPLYPLLEPVPLINPPEQSEQSKPTAAFTTNKASHIESVSQNTSRDATELVNTNLLEFATTITQSSLIQSKGTPLVSTIQSAGTEEVTQQRPLPKVKRHCKSVENFCYVIESHLSMSSGEEQTLRGLINLGFTFDDVNSKESIEFLRKIISEKIILIISKASMENLSRPVANDPLLCAIYVVDSWKKNSFDSKFFRGSFVDISGLCQQLKTDLPLLTDHSTTICSIPVDFTGMSTLIYVQALKEILLESDEKRDLKKEMLDFCREEYADNSIQLKLIEEFANHFRSNDAISWYSRHESFVHKMLTRAFRVLDPDVLFKLRYFIQHLHGQLKSTDQTSASIVYRTLRIRKDLFEKIKSYQTGLLSFNEFLLVNKNQSAIVPSPMNTDSKVVHFRVVLGNGVCRAAVPTRPNEILLTVGTVFRFGKLEQIDEGTFTAELTTNNDIAEAAQLVTQRLRDAVRAPMPLIRMMKLMMQRELTDYIEYFCSMLINDPQMIKDEPASLALGGSLHALGGSYYEKKEYDQALYHLRNALKVYLRVLPENDIRLTPTYNNIGSVYHKQGLNEQALENHRKAYEIQKNSTNPNIESVAAYIDNIASVLLKLSRYNEAANYFELSLQIQQKLHPNNDHADLAIKYHNLAGAQYRLHEYSKALENYRKCLEIELKCHSAENPTVAVTYFNMATALEELGQLQEAKKAIENAIARLLLTKREDDDDLKMQRRHLQRLEQKIWMKNIFSVT